MKILFYKSIEDYYFVEEILKMNEEKYIIIMNKDKIFLNILMWNKFYFYKKINGIIYIFYEYFINMVKRNVLMFCILLYSNYIFSEIIVLYIYDGNYFKLN